MTKYWYTIFAVGTLSGCGLFPMQRDESQSVQYPANLLIRCPDIPQIGPGQKNLGDLMKYTTGLMEQYNECAIKHDSLIKTVEKNGSDNKHSK